MNNKPWCSRYALPMFLLLGTGIALETWRYCRTPRPIAVFDLEKKELHPLVFSSLSDVLVCGDGTNLEVWNWRTNKLVATMDGHRYLVESLEISASGETLFSCDRSGRILVWDGNDFQQRRSASQEVNQGTGAGETSLMVLSPDSKLLATCRLLKDNSGDLTSEIRIWNSEINEIVNSLPEMGVITAMAFSPNGAMLATIDRNDELHIWDISTSLCESLDHDGQSLMGLRFSPDGRYILHGGNWKQGPNVVICVDRESGQRKAMLQIDSRFYGRMVDSSFSRDGRFLALALQSQSFLGRISNEVRVFDWQDGKQLMTIPISSGVGRLVFSNDDKELAISEEGELDSSSKIEIWDVSKLSR
jgi:WD40 repeat protein